MNSQPAEKNEDTKAPRCLWTPSSDFMEETLLAQFIELIQDRTEIDFGSPGEAAYKKLHEWSIENREDFWDAVWDFSGVVGDKGDIVIADKADVPWFTFFPQGKISYAENMLKHWINHPNQKAIVYRHQGGPDRIITGKDLCEQVSLWEQALRREGVKENDAIGVYLTNTPETIFVLIAASNIGAPIVTAGMEMGKDDMIERFSRVKPKLLITADSYTNGDRILDRLNEVKEAQKAMPSLEKTIFVPSASAGTTKTKGLENTVQLDTFFEGLSAKDIDFIRRDFNHPLYILFSSGTTGEPKGFIHGTGGILLKHIADYKLQADVRPADVVFYHATPSWMMWNWLASGLMAGATILQHDGKPADPDAAGQLRFTSEHGCTHHGTSAAVIQDIWMANDVDTINDDTIDLSSQRSILYTGGVLPDSGFEFIIDHIDDDVQIAGITGGTDFVSVSIGGNPFMPVYAGQVAAPFLGVDVVVWDEAGKPLPTGQPGELTIKQGFPSMPLAFVDDEDGALYRDAYYDYFYDETGKRVWRHGDSIMTTPQGQVVVIGRSDATLNQNDVRIGPIKLYKQLTQDRIGDFAKDITGFTAVDFMTPQKKPKTVLFLEMKNWEDGISEDMERAIKSAIKNNVGPYSIPTEIIAVPAVLRTKNGKLAEVVTKKILNGKTIKNASLYGEDLVQHYAKIGQELTAQYTPPQPNGEEPEPTI